MKSIIQRDKERCFWCGRNGAFEPLDEHHVYGGAYRPKSERYGLKVYLHHQTCHLGGVHRYADVNRAVQERVQQIAMAHYGWTEEEFRAMFGRSYSDG